MLLSGRRLEKGFAFTYLLSHIVVVFIKPLTLEAKDKDKDYPSGTDKMLVLIALKVDIQGKKGG